MVEQWKHFSARSSEFIRFTEYYKLRSISGSVTLSQNPILPKIIKPKQIKREKIFLYQFSKTNNGGLKLLIADQHQ